MARPRVVVTIYEFFSMVARLALAGFFLLVVLATAAFLYPQQVLTIDSGEVKADALVVLGGGDGRADRGAELYQAGAAPMIVVSGYGDCRQNVQELERLGVPTSAIMAEPAARTTLENAKLSVPLLRAMRARRVILVTSWYHSRRALACFEHVAPDLHFYSRPSYFDYEPKTEHDQFKQSKIPCPGGDVGTRYRIRSQKLVS